MTAQLVTYQRHLATPDETMDFARSVAGVVQAGDCVLLDGPIGAGKTTFARALIQALLAQPEDVPSPTFTLVQVYTAPDFDVWHCDLYRLTSADELVELGLDDAFTQAVTLVEWPDRLGSLTPASAAHLGFAPDGDGRSLSVTAPAHWAKLFEHAA